MKYFKTLYLTMTAAVISCEAQKTVASLYDMEKCSNRPNKPVECRGFEDVSTVKDIDGRLDAFAGKWKGIYDGKQIELNLEKKIDFENYGIKWDQLHGKLKIKDNLENMIFDSFSEPDVDANPYGYNFQGNSYEMSFMANGNCFDEGSLFLERLQPNSNNPTVQLTLMFIRDNGFETTQDLNIICPNYNTYKTLLPNKIKITLTKQ